METEKLINDFINYLKRRGKAKSTLIAYKNDLSQLAESNLNKSLVDFNEVDIKHGLNFLQNTYTLSAKTISRKLNSIRTFYKFLEEKKYIKSNPTLNISHPKFRVKKQRFLSRPEYLALKECSRDNYKIFVIIEFLLQTGVRIGELSRIKIKDLHLSGSRPYVQIEQFGSNEERKVPINGKLSTELKIYLGQHKFAKKPNSPLFCTKTGRSIEVRNIRGSIDRVIIKAKVRNACVNDLRNTFIVNQLSNGISLTTLAEVVGHKNIATTTRYLELLSKRYKAKPENKLVEL